MTGANLFSTQITETVLAGLVQLQELQFQQTALPAPVPGQALILVEATGNLFAEHPASQINALPNPRELPVMSQTCKIIAPIAAPLHPAACPTICFAPIAELC